MTNLYNVQFKLQNQLGDISIMINEKYLLLEKSKVICLILLYVNVGLLYIINNFLELSGIILHYNINNNITFIYILGFCERNN